MILSYPHFQLLEDGSVTTDGGILVRERLRVVGAFKVNVTSTASTSYTVGTSENILLLSASAARLVTLPDATLADQTGRRITVKDVASTTATISVVGTAGTVDGATTASLTTSLGKTTYVSDGSNWWSV